MAYQSNEKSLIRDIMIKSVCKYLSWNGGFSIGDHEITKHKLVPVVYVKMFVFNKENHNTKIININPLSSITDLNSIKI
jgi:hypothetical protein